MVHWLLYKDLENMVPWVDCILVLISPPVPHPVFSRRTQPCHRALVRHVGLRGDGARGLLWPSDCSRDLKQEQPRHPWRPWQRQRLEGLADARCQDLHPLVGVWCVFPRSWLGFSPLMQ